MTSVLVGVHVHEQPDGLRTTLASLREAPAPEFELVLLPDGPDPATRRALAELSDVRQDGTPHPEGPPACFNRLARASRAEVIVLLESGCITGSGWLDRLLSALAADPRNGLAGPSTNLAWNEQAVFVRAGGTPAEIAATSAEAAERFGGETRSLAPLHGPADLCLAVRRAVVEAIGGADQGYGLGPCWEMEYAARALRAGFRAIWACGAYVHRAPFTPRRRREEAARFAASKRRYQDAVCALRLRGERADYEPHCRGEACEHFAPANLMRIARPLEPEPEPRPVPPAPRSAVVHTAPGPLVSCIMPTRDRADLALQAVRYFQRQDHDARELVIVDDGEDDLRARLPEDPRVRYLRSPPGESIGTKRNRACEAAKGELIVHWDDDDWFAPDRVRRQIQPLLTDEADMTALRAGVFFDLERWAFWRCTPQLHRRLFVEDVHGATLAYRRSLWSSTRFPAASLAEDAWFVRRAVRGGARLRRLDNDGLFVYLRHGTNSWRFPCGQYLDEDGWVSVDEPPLPPGDRAFYAARSPGAPKRHGPLVSCLMPTADRRYHVERSIRYFLRQDHPLRELIVLDDGHDRVDDLIPDGAGVRYVELERPRILGAKRNLGCEAACGDVIVHWDDDDWMAPHRLRYQVAELERAGADACGSSRLLYFDPARHAAWRYEYPAGRRTWVAGNTLCYARDVWRRTPFAEVAVGEDTRFLWSGAVRRLLPLADHRFLVGVIHDANASRKNTGDPWWRPVALHEVEGLLGSDLADYLDKSPGRSRSARASR
jgi:glycosyltransferase involved in cell wall biosynthesis